MHFIRHTVKTMIRILTTFIRSPIISFIEGGNLESLFSYDQDPRSLISRPVDIWPILAILSILILFQPQRYIQ